jgi:hypothetical protein
MAKEQSKAKLPDFHVYIVETREGKDPFWVKVGAAWANKDEKGYSVEFATPAGPARLVLREPKEPDPKSWAWVEILNPLATLKGVASLKPNHMITITPHSVATHLMGHVESQLVNLETIIERPLTVARLAVLADMRGVLQTVYALTDDTDAASSSDLQRRIGQSLDNAWHPGGDIQFAVWTFAESVRALLRRHGPLTEADIPY